MTYNTTHTCFAVIAGVLRQTGTRRVAASLRADTAVHTRVVQEALQVCKLHTLLIFGIKILNHTIYMYSGSV